MHNKIPYYMAYPEFFMYGTERTDRMDYDYMTKRIYERAQEEEENPGVWLLDLIQVMLCQELLLRRRERREKRKFY